MPTILHVVLHRCRPRVLLPVLVCLVVGVLGMALLFSSHAFTATSSTEAESGTISGGTSAKVGDTTASGGQAVRFGTTPLAATMNFGDLDTMPAHTTAETTGGVKVAMLELSWRSYEPTEGVFDQTYISSMKAQYDAFKAAGMQVTLAVGVHYTPAWAKALPNAEYLDQNGNPPSNDELNVIFNQQIRDQVAAYYD